MLWTGMASEIMTIAVKSWTRGFDWASYIGIGNKPEKGPW